jgi:hypothetical protein
VQKPPQAVTNVVSWRTEGIKYKKNEVFLDVIERLNLLVAANGTVLSSEILGSIKMRSFLSGEAAAEAAPAAQGRGSGGASSRKSDGIVAPFKRPHAHPAPLAPLSLSLAPLSLAPTRPPTPHRRHAGAQAGLERQGAL